MASPRACREDLPTLAAPPQAPARRGCERVAFGARGRWERSGDPHGDSLSARERSCWWWKKEDKRCSAEVEQATRSWQWVLPPSCTGPPLQHALRLGTLCRSARRRSLLLIGGSLTRQVYYALLQELHAAGGWSPSNATCRSKVDLHAPCVELACPNGQASVRLCYRVAYHLTSAPVPLLAEGGTRHECCHHSIGRLGAAEASMPPTSDVAAWRRVLAGVDAIVLNIGAHWAGVPGCTIGQKHPETVVQMDAAFNRTIDAVVGTITSAAAPGTALWWRSQPAGYHACGASSLTASASSSQLPEGPLRSITQDTVDCDGAPIPLEHERARAIEYMISEERAARSERGAEQGERAAEQGAAAAEPDAAAATRLGRPKARATSRDAAVRDPFCWGRHGPLDTYAVERVVAAGGFHLRADRPAMLRTDAYHVTPPKGGGADCLHTCLGATPRLYALAIGRFVLTQ